MHFIIGLVALLFGGALALRILKWALSFIYEHAPFVALWSIIILVLFNIGYFEPIKEDVKKIHADITKSIKD